MEDKLFKLGEHQGRLDAIEQKLVSIEDKLTTLVLASERRKGAWLFIIGVASFSGAAAGLALSIVKG